jgi:hypothetical protein
VSESFKGNEKFRLIGDVLYQGFRAVKLQIKGEEKKEDLILYPDYHQLLDSVMPSNYPSNSEKLLLFIAPS